MVTLVVCTQQNGSHWVNTAAVPFMKTCLAQVKGMVKVIGLTYTSANQFSVVCSNLYKELACYLGA